LPGGKKRKKNQGKKSLANTKRYFANWLKRGVPPQKQKSKGEEGGPSTPKTVERPQQKTPKKKTPTPPKPRKKKVPKGPPGTTYKNRFVLRRGPTGKPGKRVLATLFKTTQKKKPPPQKGGWKPLPNQPPQEPQKTGKKKFGTNKTNTEIPSWGLTHPPKLH